MGNAAYHIKTTEALLEGAHCAFSEPACKIISVENLKTDVYTVLPSWSRRGPRQQDCGLFHFDSCFSLDEIKRAWQTLSQSAESAINSYAVRLRKRAISEEKAFLVIYSVFGIILHKAQDFYAHSNWIELLSGIASGSEIATWDEAMAIVSSGVNPRMKPLLEKVFTVAYRQKTIPHGIKTHGEMNIDNPDTPYARTTAPCSATYYELALNAASRATLEWSQKVKNWVADEGLWKDLCGGLKISAKTQEICCRELREVLALSRYGKKINWHTVSAYINWHNSNSDASKQAVRALLGRN